MDERSPGIPAESADGRLRLQTAIGTYPHSMPLKDGRVRSDRLALDFVEVKPANRAFRPMVNQLAYHVSEMALVTLALGRAFERSIVGIPIVMMCQSAHRMLLCRRDSPLRGPRDLAGKTLGVRSYGQTTGTWTRGILQDQYGVDLASLQWVTFEPAHVDGYEDPENARRAAEGKALVDMLLAGELDAGVGLEPNVHPDLRPVIPDVAEAERVYEALVGAPPLNHLLVVQQAIAAEFPWVPDELYRLFVSARATAAAHGGVNVPAPGLEPNRRGIEMLTRYAFEQHLVPRPYTPEELFLPLG